MELQLKREELSFLKPVLQEVQELEQTQEVRLPEDMPEVGRILGAWGQPVMRSKQWQGSTAELSAGMMVWVLYIPESGESPRQVEAWIPFRMRWDLPEGCPDGKLRILILPRFVDARSVSAGKIIIRAGVSALAEGWCPHRQDYCRAEAVPKQVELLRRTYPLRLPREAGEKQFQLDEELTLPASAPQPEKLLYYRLDPTVTDRKVLADKVVFRGSGNLHLCYASGDGQLHTWDFELPFSQFGELEESHSPDAQADVLPMVTNLELERDEEGALRMQAGLTAQYLVDDRQLLELTEDAYSPERELRLHREELELPALLESRRENIYGEQTIPGAADLVVDAAVLPDFPRQQTVGEDVRLEQPGMVQVLYYDGNGQLQTASRRWQGSQELKTGETAALSAIPQPGKEPQVLPGGEEMTVRTEIPLQVRAVSRQGMPMVTGAELGDPREKDPMRPSLILRRASQEGLWELAKASGSTVDSIRTANALEGEPEPGRMLLIPVL